jgi:hypothetical protein
MKAFFVIPQPTQVKVIALDTLENKKSTANNPMR